MERAAAAVIFVAETGSAAADPVAVVSVADLVSSAEPGSDAGAAGEIAEKLDAGAETGQAAADHSGPAGGAGLVDPEPAGLDAVASAEVSAGYQKAGRFATDWMRWVGSAADR